MADYSLITTVSSAIEMASAITSSFFILTERTYRDCKADDAKSRMSKTFCVALFGWWFMVSVESVDDGYELQGICYGRNRMLYVPNPP